MIGYGYGFGWAWYLPDDDPDGAGTAWISIEPRDKDGHLAGDEICVIICRDYDKVAAEHPDWIRHKESDADSIVRALEQAGEAPGESAHHGS